MEDTKINKTKVPFSRKDTARNKLQFRLINVVIKAGQSSRVAQRRGNKKLGYTWGWGGWSRKVSWEMENPKKGFGKTREEGCVEEIQ